MIGVIARAIGLDSLVVYAIIAALAGGGIWGYGAVKYHKGEYAGMMQERAVWEKEKALLIRLAEVERKVKQARIDQIESENLQNEQRADKAEADLEKAIHDDGQSTTPAIPRSISRAINGVR